MPVDLEVPTSGGSLLFFVSGSGYRTAAQGAGEVEAWVFLDGQFIAKVKVFANETGSHRALIPAMGEVFPPAGDHHLTITAQSGTFNSDDTFTIYASELQH